MARIVLSSAMMQNSILQGQMILYYMMTCFIVSDYGMKYYSVVCYTTLWYFISYDILQGQMTHRVG